MYTNVKFHALNMDTRPEGESLKKNANYLADDISELDIARRTIFTIAAIEASYSLKSTTPNTLNIFMLPEFYWRGSGGYYPDRISGKEVTSYIIDAIKPYLSEARFKDWLFVLGTCISGSDGGPLQGTSGTVSSALIRNIAIVIEGGMNGATFKLAKRSMSEVDFSDYLKPDSATGALKRKRRMRDSLVLGKLTAYAGGDTKVLSHRSSIEIDGDVMGGRAIDTNVKDGIFFESKGIQFALEICLDHQLLRSWKSLFGPTPVDTNQQPYFPQIILIPSAGADINDDNKVVDSAMLQKSAECLLFNNNGMFGPTPPTDPSWYGDYNIKSITVSSPIRGKNRQTNTAGGVDYTDVALDKVKALNVKTNDLAWAVKLREDANYIKTALGPSFNDMGDRLKGIALQAQLDNISNSLSEYQLRLNVCRLFILALINRNSIINAREITGTLAAIRGIIRVDDRLQNILSGLGMNRVLNRKSNLSSEELRGDIIELARSYGWEINGRLTSRIWWERAVDGLNLEDMQGTKSYKIASFTDNPQSTGVFRIVKDRVDASKQKSSGYIQSFTGSTMSNDFNEISSIKKIFPDNEYGKHYVIALHAVPIPALKKRV